MGRTLDELWKLVRLIPRGRVAAYGALGRELDRPVSGLVVGKWIARAPADVPWWRVIGADGRLPVHKRDPSLALLQRHQLESEGVHFDGERVRADAFWDPQG